MAIVQIRCECLLKHTLVRMCAQDCKLPADLLAKMRREFEYWYPFDLRVSGKVRFEFQCQAFSNTEFGCGLVILL